MPKKKKTLREHIEDNPGATPADLQKQFPEVTLAEIESAVKEFQEENPAWEEPPPYEPEPVDPEVNKRREAAGFREVEPGVWTRWRRPPPEETVAREAEKKKRDDARAAFIEALEADATPYALHDDRVYDLMKKRLAEIRKHRAQRDKKSPFNMEYRAKGAHKQKTVAFVVEDEARFAAACEHLGISFRQGLHIAMKLFSDFHYPGIW